MKSTAPDERPLVSLIVLCYQQEEFVEESIASMFDQDYRPLEIIICDDCSQDATVEKIEATLANAPDDVDVKFIKNMENLGISGNINSGFDVSSGDYIFMAAGDDISVPERVSRCMDAWAEADYEPDLMCSKFEDIDEDSNSTGVIGGSFFFPDTTLSVDKWRCGATGACAAYSRRVFLDFGPIDNAVRSEDWVLSFRAWLLGGGLFIDEPLVKHRTHSRSISVQVKSVNDLPTSQERRAARQKIAVGGAGIAREWARAWKAMGRDEARGRKLEQQAELDGMIVDSFHASRLTVLGMIWKLIMAGRPRIALRMFIRNICGIH